MTRLIGIVAICLLTGCASSPPVQYFALAPVAMNGPALRARSMVIQIAQVHLPPALDRKQLVRSTGSYTLDISDQHRWSAPLDEMIRRVLSQDLIQRLPPHDVVLPQEPAPAGTRKIVVDVLEFAPDAAGTVQFKGTWSLTGADGPPQSHYFSFTQSASATDTVDQVNGMSHILERLAVQITQATSAEPQP